MHITAQTDLHALRQPKSERPELLADDAVGQLAVDILETAASIFVIAPIAGVDEKSVAISIDDDLLVISGERVYPQSCPQNAKKHAEECYWGTFQRSILLPTAINSADITAKMVDHILTIEIPKARKATSKIIPLFQQS